MSKSIIYDFDEIDWEDSFTPNFSSTQTQSGKRQSEDVHGNEPKKMLVSTESKLFEPVRKIFCEKSLSKSKNDSSVNKVVRRVFPGPAGLLPDRLENNKSISELVSEDLADESDDGMLFCSQRTVSEFKEGPWKKMVKDFSVPEGEQLYEKFNISWIKKNSALQKIVVSYKAPFLASVIHSIEVIEGKIPTINVTLKDSSGVIEGTISHILYEEYAAYFTVGSVLVLKQLGILSVGDSYCVTITPTNLLTIYHKAVPKKTPISAEKVVIHEMSIEEIWSKYNQEVKENLKQQCNPTRRINENSEKLVKYPLNNIKTSTVSLKSGFTKIDTSIMFKQSGLVENVMNVNNRSKESDIIPEVHNRISSIHSNSKRFDITKTLMKNESKEIISDTKNSKEQDRNKSDNVILNCSEVLVQTDKKNSEIWKSLFEEVDVDSLFDDF